MKIVISLHFIILLTSLLFFSALKFEITNWDDQAYVTNNTLIHELSAGSIIEIFKSVVVGHYHPLTVLSLAFEYKYFKAAPFIYHIDNILLHLVNVALVFFLIFKLSKHLNVSLIVALLFAVHPLQIEAVAWISERKNVLYSFFFLLSLNCYQMYVAKLKQKVYYICCLVFFICSLLSKSSAVTLPLTLLCLDYYSKRQWWNKQCIVEKIPFFVLSIVFGLIAMKAVTYVAGTPEYIGFPNLERLIAICYRIGFYIAKTILPINLSVYYHYPEYTEGLLFYLSPLVIVLIVFFLVYPHRLLREVRFGLFFFFLNIFIVLRILPVGQMVVADRYMYIPSIGLFFIAAKTAQIFFTEIIPKKFAVKYTFVSLAMFYILIIYSLSLTRIRVWQNSETLWNDVVAKYLDSWRAHSNLCDAKLVKNKVGEALDHCNEAIKLNPKEYKPYHNRGHIYILLHQYDKAIEDLSIATDNNPKSDDTFFNLGVAYEEMGELQKAIINYSRAIATNNKNYMAYNNRGTIYRKMNKLELALKDYSAAIKITPDGGSIYYNRSMIYILMEQYPLALNDAVAAEKLKYPGAAKLVEGLQEVSGQFN